MHQASRVLVAMMATAASLSAQVSVTSDVAFNSQYQWRGISITNRPVIQPDLIVAVPMGRATLTAGAWASFEAGRYNGERHISENGGQHAGLSEYDFYVETAIPVRKATFTVGATTYSYPNTAGLTSSLNTLETYAKAAFDVPLAPSLAVWQDVQTVKGAYAELSLSQGVGPISVGALAGWNFGQSVGDGGASGNFDRRGFTHADVSASTKFSLGGMTATPSAHVILTNDPFTCIATPLRQSRTKLWAGMTLSWARELGKGNK